MVVSNMMRKVLRAKLITLQNEIDGYITYVFENPEAKLTSEKYIMCTRFPNWRTDNINIGDEGFLEYNEVSAGDDYWFDYYNNQYVPYKYTNNHFVNFIKDKEPIKKQIIL